MNPKPLFANFVRAFLLCVVIVSSCSREKKEADQADNPRGGRCYITKDDSNYVCLDFNDGYDATTGQSTCATEYDRYHKGTYVWGSSWLVGDFNTCDTAGKIGSCARADGILYYFSKFGTATSAEADCAGVHAGVWTP